MFGAPLRLAHSGHANGAKITGLRVGRTAAIGAAEAFWLALIAASFALWAISPSANQSYGLTASSQGCVLVGKAGVICSASASAAQLNSTESNSCNWRYCPRPAK